MIVCIEITLKTKDELDRLLAIGGYRDYSEAVSIAVANQVLLHREKESAGSVVLGQQMAAPPTEVERQKPLVANVVEGLPPAFSLSGIIKRTTNGAPLPNDSFVNGQEIPLDRWIFGQHNKLLPVKASCRALARMLSLESTSGGVPLSKAAADIASDAVKLGDYLRMLESRSTLTRDESISVAFPYSDSPNGDKSRLRYANQFVASLTTHGKLSGLLVDLKLINQDHSKNRRLLLTDQGWQFALLSNPILDSGSYAARQEKFSGEEVELLVEHIRLHVPTEDFAYRAVLNAIFSGANTPDQLDEALGRYVSERQEKPFTKAFVTTQRAGVISRMSDLGLVQRSRDGVKVTYVVSGRGSEFLSRMGTERLTA